MNGMIKEIIWRIRHRWACFKEKWPLMLLSTHTTHVLALHARLKGLEKRVKDLEAAEKQTTLWRSKMETENWNLRGDLAMYEAAHRKAVEAVGEMKHILTCHREEISWGVVDVEGTIKDRPVDPMTRTRFDELDRVIGLADEFEKASVPTVEDEEWPDVIGGK